MSAPATHAARGASLGLLAAALFGLSAPIAKRLLPASGPVLLAGLLYAGAGLALALSSLAARAMGVRAAEARLRAGDVGKLAVVVLAGGVVGPVAMLAGLARVSGVLASLSLNLEAPFTLLVAVAFFGDHLSRRALLAASLVLLGSALLSHPGGGAGDGIGAPYERAIGIGLLALACLAWALDNNVTQTLALRDPVAIARLKGLCAGACNLALALSAGERLPPARPLCAALVLGAFAYGASVVLHIRAVRELGAARQALLFAAAPFCGAVASVPILGDTFGRYEIAAACAMAAGIGLLLREDHAHRHTHEALEHDHLHVHDEHHLHAHEGEVGEGPHAHPHRHEPLTHEHPHAPDAHHRHTH